MNISTIGSLDSPDKSMVDNDNKMLGKQDFLNLLLKQLSYQDPLNPMDSTEFTVQLSQFSSLEELNNINTTLSDVLAFQHSMQNAAITGFIGKTVKASGNTTYLKNTADISYELAADASSVNITVTDAAGKIVWSKDLGPQPEGAQSYVWDGMDNAGNQLPEGIYSFDVQAMDSAGNPVNTSTNASGTVVSIFFEDNATYLVLDGGRRVHLSEIRSIES